MGTALAPASAMGQPFLQMTYNDKINKTEVLNFDASLLPGSTTLSYQNLYILTSGNTASASEIIINCLRPYMEGRLYQVGMPTFGKNVAQQLFTNEEAPNIELWLTTTYLSNSQGFYEYYTNGLQPDFEVEENYAENWESLVQKKTNSCNLYCIEWPMEISLLQEIQKKTCPDTSPHTPEYKCCTTLFHKSLTQIC